MDQEPFSSATSLSSLWGEPQSETTFLKSDSVESTVSNYDVIIVGAGLSGLCAAHFLLSREPTLRVVVLEREGFAGGRLCAPAPEGVPKVHRVDHTVFSSSQTHLHKLLQRLSMTTYPLHKEGKKICQLRNGSFQRFSSNFLHPGNTLVEVDLVQFAAAVDKMSLQPHQYTHLDNMSMGEFLNKEAMTQTTRDTVTNLIRTTLGVEPASLSAFYFVLLVNGTNGMYNLFNCRELGMTQHKRDLIEVLEERINCVKVNEHVQSVDLTEDRVFVKTSSNNTYRAEFAILAIPPEALLKLQFRPELNKDKEKVIRMFQPGHFVTVNITYKEVFWRKTGDCGQVVGTGERWPIQAAFDTTTPDGPPTIYGIIGGDHSRKWSNISSEDRKRRCLDQLARYWGNAARYPVGYADHVWYDSGGGMKPGAMGHIDAVKSHSDRVFFAGTEMSTRWPGFENGAVHAGQRAALEVLADLRPQAIKAEDFTVIDDHRHREMQYSPVLREAAGLVKPIMGSAALAGISYALWRIWNFRR